MLTNKLPKALILAIARQFVSYTLVVKWRDELKDNCVSQVQSPTKSRSSMIDRSGAIRPEKVIETHVAAGTTDSAAP